MSKTCKECNQTKPLSEFHKDKKVSDGHNTRCKFCRKEEQRIYYQENRDRILEYQKNYNDNNLENARKKSRDWHHKNKDTKYLDGRLQRVYGITLEDYSRMLDEQNNVCAICGKPESAIHNKTKEIKRLAVDHDHVTGKVRGLLCAQCNKGLGSLGDTIEAIEKTLNYLKKERT